jgi:hypothetical protein
MEKLKNSCGKATELLGISFLSEVAEKVILFELLKNGQMQSPRSPESGVATNKERLLPRQRVSELARGVIGRTPQQACPVLDTGKDEPACR